MNRVEQGSSESLLTCFLRESETHFRFLELEGGFHYYSGLVHTQKGRQLVVSYRPGDSIPVPFTAITRYERERQSIEIIYYEDRFSLECYLSPDGMSRITLDEFLKAVKKTDRLMLKPPLALQPDGLTSAIQFLSGQIKEHVDNATFMNAKVFERALSIREKLLEQGIREQYERQMQHISTEAARAFLHKDFPKVVALFRPYERHLSPADLKKLDLARRKIVNG